VPDRILPEFQDFLLSRSLAPAKNAPFYAHWVSKFLTLSNRYQDLSFNLKVEKFLTQLKSQKKTADWQVGQAEGADLRRFRNPILMIKLDVTPS